MFGFTFLNHFIFVSLAISIVDLNLNCVYESCGVFLISNQPILELLGDVVNRPYCHRARHTLDTLILI